MREKLYISKYAVIENGSISVDNQEVFKSEAETFSGFAKLAYQHLNMTYPKFFKMDELSKLAVLGAESLLNKDDEGQDIALVLANKSSSLHTDLKHQESISDASEYYPSPAVFVYTLANICLGEVSIRHRLQSENVFFIAPSYPVALMENYAAYLLAAKKAKKVLCGWVEYYKGTYKLVFYMVESHGTKEHNKIEIQKIIN
ncbi:3-oxoacyl-ACP synthase [Flavobacterium sp. NKUCC04_CG]|uniref:3-oxoacyl-ACP synthase n=1 Tax=Flavobacterium sp. NKUCC04_CG TaxID=2842121 RepID=UPI001C5AC251|nr:3-oxoacyl-ACP synthase [Flavobacterium sp. NKUCC04_CG]